MLMLSLSMLLLAASTTFVSIRFCKFHACDSSSVSLVSALHLSIDEAAADSRVLPSKRGSIDCIAGSCIVA